MKKGLELTLRVLIGLVLLILVVALFWSGVAGNLLTPNQQPKENPACRITDDCIGNPDGLLCMQSPNGNYCGCILTSHTWGDEPQCIGGYDCVTGQKKCAKV